MNGAGGCGSLLGDDGFRLTGFRVDPYTARQWLLFISAPGLHFGGWVTFVTRCYEAGIPREHVMRLAGHASVLAHEIYPRLPATGDLLQELRKMM